MPSLTVVPSPFQTALDSDGNPLAGAQITVYDAGTSNLATTWADADGDAENANPIVANGSGRWKAFLTPGQSYDFVFADADGVEYYSVPGILAQPGSSDSTDIVGTYGEDLVFGIEVYLSDGSGSRTAGRWYKTDADLPYASLTPEIGMVITDGLASATGTIRLIGEVPGLSGLTVGASYYVSSSPGAITATPPPNARFVGVASSTTSLIVAGVAPGATGVLDLPLTAGEGLTQGQAGYLSDGQGSKTAGRVYRTDATLAYASSTAGLVGIVLMNLSTGESGLLRILGRATGLSGLTVGGPIYLSNTPGALSGSAGTYTRVIGVAESASVALLMPPPVLSVAPSTVTTTGTQTALAIPVGNGPLTIIANNATLLTVQGIAAGQDGQVLTIISKGAGQVDIVNQSGSASAANRVINGIAGNRSLAAGVGNVTLSYDVIDARWRVVEHNQGAGIMWTPSIGGSTSQSGQTYTTRSARFTLVESRVLVEGYIVLSAAGTITGDVQIQGLPFANAPGIITVAQIGVFLFMGANFVNLAGLLPANVTAITFYGLKAAAASSAVLAQADLSNTTQLYFNCNYETA